MLSNVVGCAQVVGRADTVSMWRWSRSLDPRAAGVEEVTRRGLGGQVGVDAACGEASRGVATLVVNSLALEYAQMPILTSPKWLLC